MAKEKLGRMAVSQIKNTAKSCYFLTKQKEKLEAEIAAKQKELEDINLQWDEYQAPIRRMTGGYATTELVDRVVTDTGKVDKDGKPIKVTNYVLKYPETVVPVEAAGNAQPEAETPAETTEPQEAVPAMPTID